MSRHLFFIPQPRRINLTAFRILTFLSTLTFVTRASCVAMWAYERSVRGQLCYRLATNCPNRSASAYLRATVEIFSHGP